MAFALVVFNGFGISRLFLLWGVMYILTGWLYKVPVSVQPLKAMAVIAISSGISIEMLTGTSFFYGILLIVLSLTGAIRWLQKWFSPALVKGIQLGIGLILAQKAIEMVIEKGFLLFGEPGSMQMNFLVLLLLLPFLWVFQFRKKIPIALILILVSIVIIKLWGGTEPVIPKETLLDFTVPKFSILLDAFFLLIIPQLPLTLGNAMFAASDASHSFWGKQAERVNPTRFGLSIGIGNSAIGLLGGFPMCHGAGGIAAHNQFGGKTGGTTIIIGVALIVFALISPLSAILFLIPVPLLAAMLLFDSWRMIALIKKLDLSFGIVVAILVGLISFFTRNLSIALISGLVVEQSYGYIIRRKNLQVEN